MDLPKKIQSRVEQLCNKYSDGSINISKLLCDDRPSDNLAFRIYGNDMIARDLSYGELRKESELLACGLVSRGVEAGDRIATLMGKSREYLITLMAIWRLGAVHVPLFTAFSTPAIALRLNKSIAKMVVCDETQQSKLKPSDEMVIENKIEILTTANTEKTPNWAQKWDTLLTHGKNNVNLTGMDPDSPIIHIFTSGTTGQPKGLTVPIKALACLEAYAEFALDLRPDDIFWNAADPGWAYGLFCGILASLTTGTPSILLQGGFDPQVTLNILKDQKVTNFAAAPTVYRSIRSAEIIDYSGINLRCASSAGEPLTPEINGWSKSALGVPVHDHYGQTETSMVIQNHHHPLLKNTLRNGSMGNQMPGWEAVILKFNEDIPAEPGQLGRVSLVLKNSPFAWFTGYIGNKEKSAEKFSADGTYYLTGDSGSVDEDGYFYFSTRDDDVIIMAGYRIGPFEVESALSTHEAVNECAVIAAPDEVRGEVIEAFVILKPDFSENENLTTDLQKWVKTHFAAHAYPRKIHYVSVLPKTPSGKIQRFLLRKKRQEEVLASRN
jgi:acetyl-CoA synthetase